MVKKMRLKNTGQAVIEIAIFGAIVIFLIGTILRTHLSNSFSLNHQVRATKLALQQSYLSSTGPSPNSSRNSASVLFIEDRLTPDLNKFNTIDRGAFVASGSGTMSNRLQYPIDYGEVQDNLPIMDIFVNGQHFPLTTASYVFRIIYPSNPGDSTGAACPADRIGATQHGPEFAKCLRQEHEWQNGSPIFYSLAVNGTRQYNPTDASTVYDLMRNNWPGGGLVTLGAQRCPDGNACPNTGRCPTGETCTYQNQTEDDVVGCPGGGDLCKYFS